jgi:hypothetical protein
MNSRRLQKLGVPEDCVKSAFAAIQVKDKYNWKAVQKGLENKGVRALSVGADEVLGVYKDIDEVMREQADLVEIVARFNPRIVKMCDDGSKAEDRSQAASKPSIRTPCPVASRSRLRPKALFQSRVSRGTQRRAAPARTSATASFRQSNFFQFSGRAGE